MPAAAAAVLGAFSSQRARAVYFRVQMAPRELHSSFTTLLYSESDTLMPCTGAKRAVVDARGAAAMLISSSGASRPGAWLQRRHR